MRAIQPSIAIFGSSSRPFGDLCSGQWANAIYTALQICHIPWTSLLECSNYLLALDNGIVASAIFRLEKSSV